MVFGTGGMIEITFKETFNDGLFGYLYVKEAVGLQNAVADKLKFHTYLSLAKRLTTGLECYVITRNSPFLSEVLPVIYLCDWFYHIQSDDFYGLGIDRGFTQTHQLTNGQEVKEQAAVFPLNDLLTLQSFPEDTFGDQASHLTIVALKKDCESDLLSFLNTRHVPYLPELLLQDELFIHLSCGKRIGYYDTILIKSVSDRKEKINQAVNMIEKK
jgi:hypothetical protein